MRVGRGNMTVGALLIQCHAERDIVASVDESYSEMLGMLFESNPNA